MTLEHILWLPRESGQTYPVVIRTEIDYRRAAKLGDRLVIEGWLDQVEHVRFWCGFRITRPQDNMLIVTCRQMLALVEMPSAKLWRLTNDWQEYRKTDCAPYAKGECQIGIVSGEERIE